MSNPTIRQVADRMIELAKMYPSNVYNQSGALCLYSKGINTICPQEGCIVGQAVRDVWPEKYKEIVEGEDNGQGYGTVLTLLSKIADTKDPLDVNLYYDVAKVQRFQDRGDTWGESIKALTERNV